MTLSFFIYHFSISILLAGLNGLSFLIDGRQFSLKVELRWSLLIYVTRKNADLLESKRRLRARLDVARKRRVVV